MTWDDDQRSEAAWWGDCSNTFGEETKQLTYARKLGLDPLNIDGHWPTYDLTGRSVLDIGGGPVSLLLKTINRAKATVVDPCRYPDWIRDRYTTAGIAYLQQPGEQATPLGFDEAWIYNVLQHVQDPGQIIRNAKASAPVVRLFEWIGIPAHFQTTVSDGYVMLSANVLLEAGNTYRCAVQATTADGYTMYYASLKSGVESSSPGVLFNMKATSRSDGGAWTDDSSKLTLMQLVLTYFDDGAGIEQPIGGSS